MPSGGHTCFTNISCFGKVRKHYGKPAFSPFPTMFKEGSFPPPPPINKCQECVGKGLYRKIWRKNAKTFLRMVHEYRPSLQSTFY